MAGAVVIGDNLAVRANGAVDLCEVSPNYDASGVSAVVAAELVREVILGLGPGRGR